MKKIYLFIIPLIISCSKSIEDRCFMSDKENSFEAYVEEKPYTIQQILNEKPDYLEIENLKNYRSFKTDSIGNTIHNISKEEEERKWKAYKNDYQLFNEAFSEQFWYLKRQQIGETLYALARNGLGYWLLKTENNKPSAYFLGLSFSHYYFNEVQEEPIIKGDYLQIEGSLVKIVKVPGLPGYDDYSAMEDGKLFKIKLKDLMLDSDQDGYNDIFEKSFGLNPYNKDTDGDGINDFDDMNPMYKSEKNKYTQLYEQLLQANSGLENPEKLHYTFRAYQNDCDYFHQVNPYIRVLFIPEEKKKQTSYNRVTNIVRESISKMKKDEKNPDILYFGISGNSSMQHGSAEYKNGEWDIALQQDVVI
ncbi:hypothetical protein KRE40_07065 [Elizabethkingia meningoseptica]|uniref:Uncharacterized protein n=1 Tax=Elizabethkingia meningoseptica TaxID=238 RepID=A0A1T3ID82_ELIME|nr:MULTISPECIES: hypothetical protein [Elizabethkingia]AQX13374.1 hypothetical protein BBD35_13805 [Elizabethkingia meningoseptica]EJK5327735.1 hypothetical protein [Elizabethkingia meningoseptica]MBG0515013.1 hypothetical protein [Elizabethkingia meningoseptica]MDE5434487.1 hypothetical protein [Elizabethkingia meningoseptica]MDE5436391.1 hypothetical protein [Elizabethkingia meningoseptica]